MPNRPQRRSLFASANPAPANIAAPRARRGVVLGVAAIAALLHRSAASVAELAARLVTPPRALAAALRHPVIAPLVVCDDLGALSAAVGATSATLPARQRLALAPTRAPRVARRRGVMTSKRQRATAPAKAPRGRSPAATSPPRGPGELAQVRRATERLWRRAHLTYDETREIAKYVRHQLELRPPAHRRGARPRLGEAEIARLLAAAYRAARTARGGDGSRARGLLVKTLLLTGARVAEFVRLRAEDLDVEAAQIRIQRGKGDKARVVPILPELAHELRTHLGRRRAGWLFETVTATSYSPRRVQYIVREVAVAAGIVQRVYPHLFRHTIAQHLLDRGMPIEQVAKFLGHDDIKTTQIYAEASPAATSAGYRRALGGGVSASWSGDAASLGLVEPPAPARPASRAGARRGPRDGRARPRGNDARPGRRRRGGTGRAPTARATRGRTS